MISISVDLSPTSINKAIKAIKKYKKDLNPKCDALCMNCCKKGQEDAFWFTVSKQVYSGTLLDIAKDWSYRQISSRKWEIYNDNPKAIFVEFGTGVKGVTAQHPYANKMGWSYMNNVSNYSYFYTRKYGALFGWWYPTDSEDQNKFKKRGSDGNLIAFTEGMKSRPMAVDTARQLRRNLNDIARETFNK